MNVAVVMVRKGWNNAATFLAEGIKRGISDLVIDSGKRTEDRFVFIRFSAHNDRRLYLDPERCRGYDVLLIPFWIGPHVLDCNLAEIKERAGCKIVVYSGRSIYHKSPPFRHDVRDKDVGQGELSARQWENFEAIDKFLTVKKLFPYHKEFEVGCGQFGWIGTEKASVDGIILDNCKRGWDEPIWEDFKSIHDDLMRRTGAALIQIGSEPYRFPGAGVFDRDFTHYRRMCKLLGRAKVFFAMNESFGFSILDNKMAGNLVLVHESAELPSFHLAKGVLRWNKENVVDIVDGYLKAFNSDVPCKTQAAFVASNPDLVSWSGAVGRIIDELHSL